LSNKEHKKDEKQRKMKTNYQLTYNIKLNFSKSQNEIFKNFKSQSYNKNRQNTIVHLAFKFDIPQL